jgi:hypothetical protein
VVNNAFRAGRLAVPQLGSREAGEESPGASALDDEEKMQVIRLKRGRMKSILDRSFRYTPSVETDLRKTFARIRRKQRDKELAQANADAHTKTKVLLMNQLKKASGTVQPRSADLDEVAPLPSRNTK